MSTLEILANMASGAIGGAIALAGAWFSQRADREHKQAERLADQRESRRGELRSAYAEFIAAYAGLLDAGETWIAILSAVESQRQDAAAEVSALGGAAEMVQGAYDSGASGALVTKSAETMDAFIALGTEATTKAMLVLLVESHSSRRALVNALLRDRLLAPDGVPGYEDFRNHLTDRRGKLDALTDQLGGAFATVEVLSIVRRPDK